MFICVYLVSNGLDFWIFRMLWRLQRYLCYMMGLIAVIWGAHRIYLLSFLVVVVLVSIALCQLISLLAPPEVPAEAPDSAPGEKCTASQSTTEPSSQPKMSPSASKTSVPTPKSSSRNEKEDLEMKNDEDESEEDLLSEHTTQTDSDDTQ